MPTPEARHRFALCTAFVSFLLIVAGGLVTSTGSGLAVPDWPLSYGTLFPPMVGGIRFEHSHRMIASVVGLLTLILTLWLLKSEHRVYVRRLSLFAFGLVVFQGILGGLTVLWQLPTPVSVAHACMGQTFFATMAVLAATLSPSWRQRTSAVSQSPTLTWTAAMTTAAIYGQLILGAIVRHTGWLNNVVMAHLFGAVIVTVCVVVLWRNTVRAEPVEARIVFLMAGLLLLQWSLGLVTFFSGKPVLAATSHVAVGALLLATSALLTARLIRFRKQSPLVNDLFTRPLSVYVELTKPRLTSLAVITSFVGFLLASRGAIDLGRLLTVLIGTALVGGGAGALNQYLERDPDGRMNRTRNRPLPSGRLQPESALVFGVALSVAGLLLLTFGSDPLAGVLAVLTLASYLFLYTPLKSRSAVCTLVGAIPGAFPPLIGWAAARGSLGLSAWLLFAILFLWQLPHFLAIAWTYREDYARANFKMLPVLDPEGGSTGRQIALYCLALVPVSLMPTFCGLAGSVYFLVALVSTLAFVGCGLRTAWVRSASAAHRLFVASIVYLPAILIAMTLDKVI